MMFKRDSVKRAEAKLIRAVANKLNDTTANNNYNDRDIVLESVSWYHEGNQTRMTIELVVNPRAGHFT